MKHDYVFKTDEATSQRMSHVHTKRGKAERKLAKALWHQGFRYRLNYKKLPGSPDIALTKYKIAVFVDGEFWHGYEWDKRKEKLKSNRDYWIEKIEENIARDNRNDALLRGKEWTTIHFWEKAVLKDTEGCIEAIREQIFDREIRSYE